MGTAPSAAGDSSGDAGHNDSGWGQGLIVLANLARFRLRMIGPWSGGVRD
jgi:hypothetical protein